MTIDALIKQHTLKTLAEHNGNKFHTAYALGISVRTLRKKLKEYIIDNNGENNGSKNQNTSRTSSDKAE